MLVETMVAHIAARSAGQLRAVLAPYIRPRRRVGACLRRRGETTKVRILSTVGCDAMRRRFWLPNHTEMDRKLPEGPGACVN